MRIRSTAAGLLALTLAMGTPAAVFAQEKPLQTAVSGNHVVSPSDTAAFLDAFFAREEIKKEGAATTVSVVQNGRVIAEKGYGSIDKTSGKPVDPAQTPFRVGSISKVFTVMGIMQLADEGKLKLDDNIEKYLDGYKLKNPFGTPVTVEMLLTHTTGFEVRDPTADNILYNPSQKQLSLKEHLFKVMPPVVREPGTSYMYDNFASELAGYIVEKVSGEPFNDYMSKHVFEPLGMTSSTFDPSGELGQRLPVAYGPDGKEQPEYRVSPTVLPEGSMLTTSSDMTKFMNAFLNGGRAADGKQILSQSSLQAMQTYHVSIHPDVPDMTYGLEAPMPLSAANGRNVIAKGGSIPGFQSYMFLLPEAKTALFVSSTSVSGLNEKLYEAFMDYYYPGKPNFGTANYPSQSQAALHKFEGIYRDLRIGSMLTGIRANADGTLTLGDQTGIQHVLKQTGDLLFVDEQGNPAAFKADEEGQIQYIKYSNPGSYAAKAEQARGFADVPADHPYGQYIYGLQSLGVITGTPEQKFGTEEEVTREQFIHALMHQFQFPPSRNQSVFKDTAESPYEAEIQGAVDLGLLSGMGNGRFEPNRSIKREEAAVIVRNLLTLSGIPVNESRTMLAGDTSPWAEAAVRTLIDLQIHGREVTLNEGVYDYGSRRALNRQELAAIQYLLMLPEKPLLP
ncbi:serine hydrolase [Paenibacillus sp. JX-17]|uniref:Serine hydrolase n=1 Tax=Paenibacillus lacisoli TaxID=3064525 RepID=A0ABT9CAI9_9BACL|nr:serine hydrolase [Paenibacillus sp. JX-17]MDO7906273.1 serine hydrolase [Paenibacillus sp. JX-17]